ncbi:hypothetical protein JCM4914_07830 [Streptomyces platensis subsp. malvinus]
MAGHEQTDGQAQEEQTEVRAERGRAKGVGPGLYVRPPLSKQSHDGVDSGTGASGAAVSNTGAGALTVGNVEMVEPRRSLRTYRAVSGGSGPERVRAGPLRPMVLRPAAPA